MTSRPRPLALDDDLLIQGENLAVLPLLPDGAFDMIYIDPPFNTGRAQARSNLRAVADPEGERTGFAGRRYRTEQVSGRAWPTPTPSPTCPATSPRG